MLPSLAQHNHSQAVYTCFLVLLSCIKTTCFSFNLNTLPTLDLLCYCKSDIKTHDGRQIVGKHVINVKGLNISLSF